MSYEPNPLQWQGSVQWYAQNKYALTNQVVYTPSANTPGDAVVYQCIKAISAPTSSTPDTDTTHWSPVVKYYPAQIQDSDTFLHFRTSINATLYGLLDTNYRMTLDENDLQNILINNMTGYFGTPRGGLQARLVYDELDITNMLTNNMIGYTSPRNGLQARLVADELDITNILTDNMGGYSGVRANLQNRLVADEAQITSILTNTMPNSGPNGALQARLVADELNISNLQNAGFLLARGPWVGATVYRRGDAVSAGDFNSIYVANSNHTSGSTFSVDLGAGKWSLMFDLTGAVLNYGASGVKTTSFNAIAGYAYFVDVTSGALNITLPASPTMSTPPITITHIDGDVTANALNIMANGNRIMGVADNLNVDKNYSSFRLVYADALRGWRLTIL